ncbi:hypothetical protein [Mycolicibacterium nivoides]|uniref:Uncharacterized protein n=1 Tax=Mycolicibacterium nivoides TaxID=2487344 RepID=A0ABW9LAX6_9MYCO
MGIANRVELLPTQIPFDLGKSPAGCVPAMVAQVFARRAATQGNPQLVAIGMAGKSTYAGPWQIGGLVAAAT